MEAAIFRAREDSEVARQGLGTKRICPETGKKFYDLGKDPIVSPYTGKHYPLSFFEEIPADKVRREVEPSSAAKPAVDEIETEEEFEEDGEPEFVSLEDADEADEADADEEEIPDLPDVDIDVGTDEEDEEDVFLEEEEGDDDLSDVIGGVDGEEER
ncbi:MAG: TIGR02300 family protein [Alphaproteobacteria bacterium]|nr:MAG: TIGR02300 family protein [Alphaproteobacteria bacterium]